MKKLQINDVSFSMLRGGLIIIITLLFWAIMFLGRVDRDILYTYNYAVLANMFARLVPMVLMVTVLPALYLEMQSRNGRLRE
ncbi:MAG: hypothetical protein FWE06_07500 [Oscillospiraceae bacterium]|nr:hypothetical protein [Oscillospiraceae bacterium]